MKRMMEADKLDHRTVLISEIDAARIVETFEGRQEVPPLAKEAIDFAKRLMGLFPAKAFNDVAVFAEGLAALLSAYDRQFAERICSPVDGLATRIKFTLTLADVKEALEKERTHRLCILSTAKWTVREHARRREEEADRNWKPTPEELERRKELAARLLPKAMKDAKHEGGIEGPDSGSPERAGQQEGGAPLEGGAGDDDATGSGRGDWPHGSGPENPAMAGQEPGGSAASERE
jgi:hypothetical protein